MSIPAASQSFSLSLSRAHHLAKRAATRANELQGRAVRAFTQTTVALATRVNEDAVTTLAARANEAEAAARDAALLIEAVAALRQAVSVANLEYGQQERLNRLAMLQRQRALAHAIAEVDTLNQADPTVASLTAAQEAARPARGGEFAQLARAIPVRVLSAHLQDRARADEAALRLAIENLEDDLAATNGSARVRVELTADAARLLGLVV